MAGKKRGGPRGPYRRMGPKDIPRHTCKPEIERTVHAPGKPVTDYLRCKTCHVSMGTQER